MLKTIIIYISVWSYFKLHDFFWTFLNVIQTKIIRFSKSANLKLFKLYCRRINFRNTPEERFYSSRIATNWGISFPVLNAIL